MTKGIIAGELESISVKYTASLLVAIINGTLRYRAMNLGLQDYMRKIALGFCQRSLMDGIASILIGSQEILCSKGRSNGDLIPQSITFFLPK